MPSESPGLKVSPDPASETTWWKVSFGEPGGVMR
jgi:hypothetical protein